MQQNDRTLAVGLTRSTGGLRTQHTQHAVILYPSGSFFGELEFLGFSQVRPHLSYRAVGLSCLTLIIGCFSRDYRELRFKTR